MHYLLSLFAGALNGLWIIFVLVIIVLLIINWKIALPILLFLIYLFSALMRQSKTGRWRFHIIWWVVQLMLITSIIYGKQIITFADKLITEYSNNYDTIYSINEVDYTDPHIVALSDSLQAADGRHLFAGLEVGMTPLSTVCHLWPLDELNDFHINGVHFFDFDRYYYKNRLYAIGLEYNETEDYSKSDTLVHFLTQKYGPPHLDIRNDSTYNVQWNFIHKNIIVQPHRLSRILKSWSNAILYIGHPQLRIEKEEAEHRKWEKENEKRMKKEQRKKQKQEKAEQKRIEAEQQKQERIRQIQDGI